MIRFALIVASTLGFFLTAALGNLMVPLLRAFGPGQTPKTPPQPEAQDAADGEEDRPAPVPTMGGLCLMVGVLAAVGVGWTAACVAQPELLGAESLFSVRLLTALLGALLFGGVGLLEDLARVLGVSLTELMTGNLQTNENRSANLRRMGFYVCPVCGNVITAVGKGSFSCCGIPLPVQEAQPEDNAHTITVEPVEDEICVTIAHPMTKSHYISFIAWVSNDRAELVKLYPEQDITVRFKKRGHGTVYAYCNRDGLFSRRL